MFLRTNFEPTHYNLIIMKIQFLYKFKKKIEEVVLTHLEQMCLI